MARLVQMTAPVLDLVYKVRALPASGQEAVVTGFAMSPGGGFNAMAAARAAGVEVTLAGSLGTGPFASVVAQELARHGIALARAPVSQADQGCCVVLIEPDGERSFVSSPGAEGTLSADDLADVTVQEGDWVLLTGYTLYYPGSGNAVSDWIAALPPAVTVMFDPSPLADQIPAEILAPVMARADWISANEAEAAMLLAGARGRAFGPDLAKGRQGAILRRGAAGATLIHADHSVPVPAHPVTVIDTNGAGDTHIGSFIARMCLTGDPLASLRYANVAAALSTTREGPATAPPSAEVLAVLREENIPANNPQEPLNGPANV